VAFPVRLGLDVFSLRSQALSPFAVLDYCAARGIEVVHFSEPRLLGDLDTEALRRLRDRADGLGIQLEVGMLSICPGATIFNAAAGTPEAQLAAMFEVARMLGSPIVRCVVGSFRDRPAPGGIEARIAETVAALRNVRTRAIEAGVKIAVENHAGDLQARELVRLIEEAGSDVVGACLDAGNALWAMEDPHLTLDTLAPYVLTSHTRDSALRKTGDGAEIAWTRMGEGNVGIDRYIETFLARCPGRPLTLEIIVMPAPKPLPFRRPEFWEGYRQTPAWEFQRFLELLESAAAVPLPEGPVDAAAELANVDASVAWTRAFLGSVVRGPQVRWSAVR
jgi:sugar phosphate isomerase/epimerase